MVLKKAAFSLIFLWALWGAEEAAAQISVPDYSFTGKEITGFSVRPGYTSVDIDFKAPNKMDIYMRKMRAEFGSKDKSNYSAEDPGFVYSNPAGTSLSSIFVGEKAFRNNVVKMFLQKSHVDVVSSYEKYSERLTGSPYEKEARLLYGMSLYETGNHNEAFGELTALASEGEEYAQLAQDALFSLASNVKREDVLEKAAGKARFFTPYSFAVWIKYLYSKDRYADILSFLDNYGNFEKDYPQFKNMRVSALYFLGKYGEAASFASGMKGAPSYPLIIDSLIMTKSPDKGAKLAAELPESDVREALLAKADVARGRMKAAALKVKKIEDDREKLALFFYGAAYNFSALTPEFLESFSFKDKRNNDYVRFYAGLKYLSQKKYAEAARSFSLVTFNRSLVTDAYFYQGIANVYIDPARAEWNFGRFISSGADEEKRMLSKFMLSQLYFIKGKFDEALILVDDCKADYCAGLKADIFLSKGEYEKSLSYAKGLKDDRSRLVRATDYYNLKDYKSALGELVKIKTDSSDKEYLIMMSLFKNKRTGEGEEILKANLKDPRIFAAGLEQLILAGEGKKALAYMETAKELPQGYDIERAKLLMNAGRKKEAEKAYKELLGRGEKIYESLDGLFELAKSDGAGGKFIAQYKPFIEKSENFEGRDRLVSRFAAYALDKKEPNLAIAYVNFFMDNHKASPYLSEILNTRANLYLFTGRYENCVADAETIYKKGGPEAEDALFLKAQCMEKVNGAEALALYRSMAAEDGRFFKPAAGRLTLLSDNAGEVLRTAEKMKNSAPDIYKAGVVRFLEISDGNDYFKYKNSVKRLSDEGDEDIRSVALWRIGRDFAERKMYPEAARHYMKGYYLFPKTSYAVKNLEGAKKSYESRNMEKEAAKVGTLLAALGIKDTVNTKASKSEGQKRNASKKTPAKSKNPGKVKDTEKSG